MMHRDETRSVIIVALDYATADEALALAGQLRPAQCRLKVGKELFCRGGPDLVRELVDQGFDVFLDLKFHDIPNTVAAACRAAAELGVWMLNVHALGGRRMMEAAREALAARPTPPLLTAVTVLTSHTAETLAEVGLVADPRLQVQRLSDLARDCGMDGVVCSAQEARMLRAGWGTDGVLVTPGIRPAESSADDQKRVLTPQQAVAAGSDYLVIGRPITRAADPAAALEAIRQQLA
ncbi:orotidine-5'-phosphate decarboxylase [Methylonatrum kenyense]|uniref:orotidine-5'-phosphate decarboxylase n=1 Tax=Methylonatrum kenyense TaxID=455253 RepID=UPI0020BE5E4A|nr:orotidine-5'-phosphate decarboxylase [Methylonatrum kenyense]MCK8515979.1 orotidine-5'-phosphate decarboxylase [Methylonatrum kenyense]